MKMLIMPITTSSSTSVKAAPRTLRFLRRIIGTSQNANRRSIGEINQPGLGDYLGNTATGAKSLFGKVRD